MDKWLNRLGQVAMVVIAIVAVVVALRPYFAPSTRRAVAEPYKHGEKINIDKASITANRTLLIATRSTCPYCTESMSFYRTLRDVPIVWIAVGEDSTTNRQYLVNHGITPDVVLTQSDSGLTKVLATPTIILVDSNSSVLKSWTGTLGPDGENELIAILSSTAISN